MADTLPIDTDSPARTELNPIARLDVSLHQLVAALRKPYTPSPQERARQAAAAEHLAQVAAGLHVAPADYERRGLDIEWHHQLDDPAVPYSPYLTLGGQS